jgi:hypothetical protein
MARTAVLATGCGAQQPADVKALARSVRALAETGWQAVLLTPGATGLGGALSLELGESRAGRRAVPVVTHVLVDPLDPALAHPPDTVSPEPLAILEAEAIAALVGSGFPVVAAEQVPVVPNGSIYKPIAATLDSAACARRLAGDLGAGVLVFVTGDDGPPFVGDIDHREAERSLDGDPSGAAELRAAVPFLRAGGELVVITTAALVPAALSPSTSAGMGILRVYRTLARPRSGAPALAAGWC